jgi:DGQHR domain-containing protein
MAAMKTDQGGNNTPALTNVFDRSELRAVARAKAKPNEFVRIPLAQIDAMVSDGWSVTRKGNRRARMSRPKPPSTLLEDRVWSVLYGLGFPVLSGPAGAVLRSGDDKLSNQIDVVAMDDEVALAVECKSSQLIAKRPNLQQELAKLSSIRPALARAVNLRSETKKTVVLALFAFNAVLSDTDRSRAVELGVALFDNEDLNYYQALAAHLGPAARYQFLSDLVPGKEIPGLRVRVPAVRTKMGGQRCYTFSISPEYLLKIGFVSHRAKGKAADINAYQRMISKSRLRDIRNYIAEDGMFPTNIVVNFERSKRGALRFERIEQEESEFGSVGWLTVSPSYRSAWIIDGQHRLYAYSGSPQAASSLLSVLAFDGLPPSQQAQLFIEINAKQKSVKQNLLRELYAELHWDSDDPEAKTSAVISKVVQTLGQQRGSPLFDRILLADHPKTGVRCISLTSVFSAIEKPGFFYKSVRKGIIVDPGPLWAGSNEAILKRTTAILIAWFKWISDGAEEWWNLGADPGGGLAMNDGVTACIEVLRSTFEHFNTGKVKLADLDTAEVLDRIKPYGVTLGHELGTYTTEQRGAFRALRGVQGQTTRLRRLQQAVHEKFPEFDPHGLRQFIDQEKAQTTEKAAAAIGEIERSLHKHVVDQLKLQFQDKPDDWWYEGVPGKVRLEAVARMDEDKDQRGGRDKYLNLIDYRAIALQHWPTFQDTLGFGKTGNKENRTAWLVLVNDMRRKVMHASSGVLVTTEQLDELHGYLAWLSTQLSDSPNAPQVGHKAVEVEDELVAK